MLLHHTKHHQTYVTNLNALEIKLNEAVVAKDLASQIALQTAFRFNAGGHINHAFFWANMAPVSLGGGNLEKGALYLT